MVIQYLHLPSVLPDNDAAYFSLLRGVIDASDPFAQMTVTRGNSAYHFRLVPSNTTFIDVLIEQIIALSNMVGIHLDISKSIKTSAIINFSLPI